jgi:hypothetical protein
VTYDSATGDVDVIGIDTGGISVSPPPNPQLHVGTLLVCRTRTIGTINPIRVLCRDHYQEQDPTRRADQFGTRLLSILEVTMYGAVKTPALFRPLSPGHRR